MELIIPCFVAVAEQDEDFPTFAEADCSVLVNEHNDDYFGVMVNCEVDVIRDRVEVCLMPTAVLGEPSKALATSRSIRLVVTIDEKDVSDAVTGVLTIRHNLNQISSFSLTLADCQYSPLTNSHIDTDVEVVITAFVEGEEFKIFTGLVDTPKTRRTKDFKLTISGRGYGKKLLNKRMTLISVQDSAQNKYRGSIIKYLAGQADITNVNCPKGDLIITDHSFQDQTIWDMIQKECEIEGWYVRFDEEGIMQVGPKIIKTDETKYPNPDWAYDEGEFVELGFNKTDKGIINQVIVMGAVFEEKIITVIPVEDAPAQEVDVPEAEYAEDFVTAQKSFASGESVPAWSFNDGDFKVTAKYLGPFKPSGYIFPKYQKYSFTVVALTGLQIMDVEFTVTGGASKFWESNLRCNIYREIESTLDWNFTEKAFSISIIIKYKEHISGGSLWITENLPAEEEADRIETTYEYTQVKASCQDSGSISRYGIRKPREQYTLNRPLAETEAQCKRVGNNKILDSHRYTKQPDIFVNFNPLLIVGHTVELDDTKIGYNGERWLTEELTHSFAINSETGAIKPRTRAGCVFYA